MRTVREMEERLPHVEVDAQLGLSYADQGPTTTFDLYRPSDHSGVLPLVVWIHGGAWISGSKEAVAPYAKLIANRGFAVAAVNYPYGPEHHSPAASDALALAINHLEAHARDYGIDPDRVVFAGDSAGANLASVLAAAVTNPEYARLANLSLTLPRHALRGVALACGIYDVSGIPRAPGIGGWGFRMALWGYLGTRSWANTPGAQNMCTIRSVTADFPPTWITGGDADPLTPRQSIPMADRLTALGVLVDQYFPHGIDPLPHEYQFHLRFPEAWRAFDSLIRFLENVTADPDEHDMFGRA